MRLFYAPEISSKHCEIPEEESRHIIKVLRLTVGDSVQLTDGKGKLCEARISQISKKFVHTDILSTTENYEKRNNPIHIAIAPPKNIDRFEWFVEKATEIGVDQITPLLCEHSERKHLREDRIERVIVAAMKQSLKAYKPIFNPLTGFSEFVSANRDSAKFVAHCAEGERAELYKAAAEHKSVTVLIGPEGDFSPEEIMLARQNDYQPVMLGKSRLRTETAGIVACHTLNLLAEDS